MTHGDVVAPTGSGDADTAAAEPAEDRHDAGEPAPPSPDAGTPSPAPRVAEPDISAELGAVREHLAALTSEIARTAAHAEAREQVIRHQRDELDALRAERRGTHLRPLVVGLQKLRADLLAEAQDAGADRSRGVLEYFADSVESVLERCGVVRLALEVGDEFDAVGQVAARSEDHGPESDRRVVAILAEGWVERDSDRVLAPAKVVVGRHQPPPTPHTDGTEPEEPTDV